MHKRGVDGFRVLQSEEKEKYQTIMLQITLDMYQTLAAAVVVLALGRFLRGRVRLLERFCIPAPVIGGVLFAIFTCVCYGTGMWCIWARSTTLAVSAFRSSWAWP